MSDLSRIKEILERREQERKLLDEVIANAAPWFVIPFAVGTVVVGALGIWSMFL